MVRSIHKYQLKTKKPTSLEEAFLVLLFKGFFVTSQNNMNFMDTSILAHSESIQQHMNKTLLKQ